MNYPNVEESWKVLKQSTKEDFDGHTNFQDLTPDERLQWASRSAMAVYWAKEVRKQAQESSE